MTDERKRVVHVERWIPRNEAESWAECVRQLLPGVFPATRIADLENRHRHALLLARAALIEAGEHVLADKLDS